QLPSKNIVLANTAELVFKLLPCRGGPKPAFHDGLDDFVSRAISFGEFLERPVGEGFANAARIFGQSDISQLRVGGRTELPGQMAVERQLQINPLAARLMLTSRR